MAVRFEMHIRRVAQLSLLSALIWLDPRTVADAQTAPADAGAPSPEAQPGASGAPPAAAAQPAPNTPAPNESFTPEASPLVPSTPQAGPHPQQAPVYPQQAPVYPQQAPVYPQPYAPPPQQPGYYGSYPPPAGYGAQHQPYPLASEYQPNEGARKHDGFFLRLKVGIGAGGARYEERVYEPDVSTVTTRGLAGNFELGIGGSVIENFILHGNIVLTALSVNKKVDDVSDNSYDKLSTGMLLLGGGATYYFMPANLYLTLILGAGAISESRYLDDDDDVSDADIDSGAGFGTSLSVGKEWWVGRSGEWGLGAAITGAFITAPMRIGELSTRTYGHSITLNFSATFN